jgi:hypothetical protein
MANIGNWPSSPGFTTANFKQATVTKRTQTASGRVIRASNGTTLWRGTLVYPPMTLAEFRPIQATVALAQGQLNDFDITIPLVSASQSVNAGAITATVDGAHTAGDTTIAVDTNATTANILKAGDVVRFANHTKVYMCTTDINTDGSNKATINIQPALVEDLSNSESVTVHNVPFRMILSNDVQEFQYRTDGLVNYEIDVEEVL